MAQIQLYEQRTSPGGAKAPYERNTVGPDVAVARGLQQLGQGVANLAEGELAIDRLRAAQDEDLERVKVGKAVQDFNFEATKKRNDLQLNATDGAQTLVQDLATWQDEYLKTAGEGLQLKTKAGQQFWDSRTYDNKTANLTSAADYAYAEGRNWPNDQLKQTTDTLANTLIANPDLWAKGTAEAKAIIDTTTGITADDKREQLEDLNSKAASAAVMGLVQKDPYAARAALRDPNATGPVAALSPEKRNSLDNQAQAEIDRRETKWKSNVREKMGAQIEMMKLGLPVDAPMPTETVRRALGDDAAEVFDLIKLSSEQFSGLSTKPTGDLIQLTATPEPTGSAKAVRAHRAMTGAAAAIIKQRQDDPMQYMVRNGLAPQINVVEALDTAKAGGDAGWANFDAVIASRSASAMQGASEMGMPAKPLTTFEAGVMSEYMRTLPADQRGALLQRIYRSTRGTPGAYGPLVNQLRTDSPVTAFAGGLYARPRPVGDISGRDAAALMLLGEDLLNPPKTDKGQDGKPKVAMPGEAEMRRAWDAKVGSAYASQPGAEAAAYQAYRASYAGFIARSGNVSGAIDTKLAKRAADLATGGVTKWSGRDVLLPWGLDATQFKDSIRQGWPNITKRYEITGEPTDYDLIPLGGDWYALARGERPVVGPDGRPARIRVSGQ